MTKNKIELHILPTTNILLGFNYMAAKCQEEEDAEPVDCEEYSLGLIFILITFTRFYR
jgi:hypothetical protein